MNRKIHIAIAEDHRLVRQGFIRMLKDYSNIHIVFEAENGKELLKQLKEHRPEIILLDIAMPVLGGIGAMIRIKERYPRIKIVVISSYSEEVSIIEYVKLGANAFLNKDCDVEELVKTMYALTEKENFFDTTTTKLLVKHGALPGGKGKRELTDREISVLRYLYEQKSSRDIADLMQLSENTIEWYKHKLLQKTTCKNITELIVYAKSKHYI